MATAHFCKIELLILTHPMLIRHLVSAGQLVIHTKMKSVYCPHIAHSLAGGTQDQITKMSSSASVMMKVRAGCRGSRRPSEGSRQHPR